MEIQNVWYYPALDRMGFIITFCNAEVTRPPITWPTDFIYFTTPSYLVSNQH